MPKVCIDPGHGGSDSGCRSGMGLWESRLVLSIGLMVRDILSPLCDVMMTRDSDSFVSLSQRCRAANEWQADIFVSLHLNYANSEASGWEVFASGSAGSNKLAVDIANAHGDEFKGQASRGIKQRGFYVITKTDMPAVLWEGGFLSNTLEAEWIGKKETQQRMAKAVAQGIINNLTLNQSKPLTLEERVVRIENYLGLE